MKAKLEFDLPEERCDYLISVHAMDWALSCWDLEQLLREKVKYGHDYKSADGALEDIRDKLYEILNSRSIGFDHIE